MFQVVRLYHAIFVSAFVATKMQDKLKEKIRLLTVILEQFLSLISLYLFT